MKKTSSINGDLISSLPLFIRQWSPAKFKVLANFLVERYHEKGVSVNDLIQQQMVDAYKGVKPKTTEGRMVADMKDAITVSSPSIWMLCMMPLKGFRQQRTPPVRVVCVIALSEESQKGTVFIRRIIL